MVSQSIKRVLKVTSDGDDSRGNLGSRVAPLGSELR